ncbi:hypothetical protein [Streptomyces sp. NPDC086787]|uniref:hypothetical protein n=1 Tax=Streptomyces sp. NPDC086787 TaxID=3365759 RepID=UPI003823ABDD
MPDQDESDSAVPPLPPEPAAEEPPDPGEPPVQDRNGRKDKERGGADGAEGEDGSGYDDLRKAQQQVYNNFYGSVDAAGAAFGFGTRPATPGLAPGLVAPEAVAAALRFHLRPEPCFTEALGRLRAEHLVVLIGPDGCGRGAGALALLRRTAGEGIPLHSLSPANALADLATTAHIKEGRAYVIRDYVGEANVEAVQAYEIGRLSEELRRKNAYLVITADEGTRLRLALKDRCVQWHAPEPVELFRHCLGLLPSSGTAQPGPGPGAGPETEPGPELLASVAEQRRPADVVAAAVAFAKDPAAAVETLRDRDSESVRDWFRVKPSADDLVPLAALAFLEGVPERTFESACALLFAHVRNWELHGETLAETPAAEPESTAATGTSRGSAFEQSRARWNDRAVGLVHVERRPGPGQDADRGERRLVFASPRIRELVIGELHGLYGYELWYPLRQWLGDLSRLSDLDARLELARGTAVLARYALTEVEEHLLRVWADGLTGQRVTAALTLQFMCEAEHLAPQALNIALRWADRDRPNRAVTTAMAFTGRLGSLYRLEALNWIWFLIGRGERIAFAARRSLVLLLQTAEQEPERALLTLRYVRTRVESASRRSAERHAALLPTVQLLEAERLEGTSPVPAALLRNIPESARHLGALWTAALLSPFRGRAVTALCRTLVDLREDPAATDVVSRLGEAMQSAMNDTEWRALSHALSTALRNPDFAIPGTRELARVLVGALRGGRPGPLSRTDSVSRPNSVSQPGPLSLRGGRSK